VKELKKKKSKKVTITGPIVSDQVDKNGMDFSDAVVESDSKIALVDKPGGRQIGLCEAQMVRNEKGEALYVTIDGNNLTEGQMELITQANAPMSISAKARKKKGD